LLGGFGYFLGLIYAVKPIHPSDETFAGSMVFTSSVSGLIPMDRLTTIPSKQSIIDERYTLPAGIWNSEISVSHFSFGARF
jgi:hypothetical protein